VKNAIKSKQLGCDAYKLISSHCTSTN